MPKGLGLFILQLDSTAGSRGMDAAPLSIVHAFGSLVTNSNIQYYYTILCMCTVNIPAMLLQ